MTQVGGSSTTDQTGEDAARQKAADDNTSVDDAVTDDPTGGTHEQVAAKQAANAMGDQDEANTGYNPPAGAEVPTAQNVRRFPELFNQEIIDSFQVKDTSTSTSTEPVSEASDNGEVDSTTVASDTSDTSSTSTSNTGTTGFFSSGTE